MFLLKEWKWRRMSAHTKLQLHPVPKFRFWMSTGEWREWRKEKGITSLMREKMFSGNPDFYLTFMCQTLCFCYSPRSFHEFCFCTIPDLFVNSWSWMVKIGKWDDGTNILIFLCALTLFTHVIVYFRKWGAFFFYKFEHEWSLLIWVFLPCPWS